MCIYINGAGYFVKETWPPFQSGGSGSWIDIGLEPGGETGLVDSTVVTEVR